MPLKEWQEGILYKILGMLTLPEFSHFVKSQYHSVYSTTCLTTMQIFKIFFVQISIFIISKKGNGVEMTLVSAQNGTFTGIHLCGVIT